ncbi:MAG: AAA domain-containing protein [Rhizomicrobium sp.]
MPQTLRELASLFPIAGCTLLSMRASFPLGGDVIDRLVIDEAAQCAPIYAVPALARARRVMLTGDLAQLPPVYTLAPHTDDRLARGLDEAVVTPFRMGATSTALRKPSPSHAHARVSRSPSTSARSTRSSRSRRAGAATRSTSARHRARSPRSRRDWTAR